MKDYYHQMITRVAAIRLTAENLNMLSDLFETTQTTSDQKRQAAKDSIQSLQNQCTALLDLIEEARKHSQL